jgi:hypothetical protein
LQLLLSNYKTAIAVECLKILYFSVILAMASSLSLNS